MRIHKIFAPHLRSDWLIGLFVLCILIGFGILSDWDWGDKVFTTVFSIFAITWAYITFAAFPYYLRLTRVLATSTPREMILVPKLYATGRNYTYHDWGADLFFDSSELEGNPEISIDRLSNNEDIEKLRPNTVVKVYGVNRKRGAIVIDTDHGLMWPRSSASVHRKGQVLAY